MLATDQLSLTFAALADPTRRAILARLSSGEATVNELAAPFDISLPAVSRHLKVLERAGLISKSRVAQSRPCKLEPKALAAAGLWLRGHSEAWSQGADRLDHLLQMAGDLTN
jgi:DNA-binding transcriptional ArsR family regulator